MIDNEQFNLATSGNTYNVVPLVAISSNSGAKFNFFSTQNLSFDFYGGGVLSFDPLLLNVSSIKESVDVETRRYKVSSVTITLSNSKYLGKRLSDSYTELINGNVEIRFKTQNVIDYDRTMLVYTGKVRRISQSDTTLTLSVEDSSEQKVHKDIPESITPETDFKSKYKNKPYPMVIGKVDRSPCVTSFNTTSEYDIDNDGVLDDYDFVRDVIADKKELSKIVPENLEIGNNTIGSSSLYAEVDEEYVGLYPRTVIDFDTGLEAGILNYTTLATNNGFGFVSQFNDSPIDLDEDGQIDIDELAANDTAANKGRILIHRKESKIEQIKKNQGVANNFEFKSGEIIEGEFVEDENFTYDRINDDNPNTCVQIEGNYIANHNYDEQTHNHSNAYLKFHFDSLPSGINLELSDSPSIEQVEDSWTRIIAKIQIIDREQVTVNSTQIYLPLVGAFTQEDNYGASLFSLSSENDTTTHSNLIWYDAMRLKQSGLEIQATKVGEALQNGYHYTFATSQEEYNSYDGNDSEASPISVVHPHMIPSDSNYYCLGLPKIRNVGQYYIGAGDGINTTSFDVPSTVRIFESQLWAFGTLDNLLEKNFYANVWGRPSELNTYFIRTVKDTLIPDNYYPINNMLNDIKENSNTTNNTPDSDDGVEYSIYPIKAIQDGKEINIKYWAFRIKDIFTQEILWFKFNGTTINDDFNPSAPFTIQLGDSNGEVFGDYNIGFDSSSERITMNPLEKPAEIVQHILEEECKYDGGFNEEEFNAIDELHPDWTFAFTQSKLISSKKLIEDFSKSTKSFPKFRADGTFGWSVVKDTYSDDDVDLTIEESDIINYKYNRTKLEDVKTNIKVLFNKDYAKGNHLFSTDEVSMNIYPDYDYNYYGLDGDTDSTLNFESDYIRDRYTAEQLRDWLLAWHMNQKNLISLTLPIKYLKLEVGDVVVFDKEIQDTKIFGESYIQTSIDRNGQEIYPYFMVYETNKNLDKVDIKVIQLHNLDINNLIAEDAETTEQDSGIATPIGDINGDGNVDILDIVMMVSIILGFKEPNEAEFFESDINQDGVINVIDVVSLVNTILG